MAQLPKKKPLAIVLALAVVFLGSFIALRNPGGTAPVASDPGIPQKVRLSGEYVCLPHLVATGPQTQECAFGLKADDGEYYAVNFGQSASAMEQFKSGARIVAEGFVVAKEALSSDRWASYNMKGIFTITNMISVAL